MSAYALQACWLIRAAADRFIRLDAACTVLPRLLHPDTIRWVAENSFEDEGDWPNLQARLKGLLPVEIIALIAEEEGTCTVERPGGNCRLEGQLKV